MKKRLIAVHLLNDRSGSPLVLAQALRVLQKEYAVTLYTATPSGSGFLSDMAGIRYQDIFYRWHRNKLVTLALFFCAQFLLFLQLLRRLRRSDTVYINTLLPFGAAIAARIKGCRIVYHVHETSLRPLVLKHFLFFVADRCAEDMLFVSRYVSEQYHCRRANTHILYNCLPDDFVQRTAGMKRLNLKTPFTVLMLCSLKAYKGVFHFVEIARSMPRLHFELVLNASPQEVALFVRTASVPANCKVYAAQNNTVPFYEKAHVVMNLSKPERWVETFGMTLLEAMHCGRPVIYPVAGGVLELVNDGVEGFMADSADEQAVCCCLQLLSDDFGRYQRMSDAAAARAAAFDTTIFDRGLMQIMTAKEFPPGGKNPDVFPEYGKQKMLSDV